MRFPARIRLVGRPVRPGGGARRAASALLAAIAVVACAALGSVRAQATREVSLSLGFGGEIVGQAWNPLRLTTRDVPPATLELRIDQGSLRDGEIPVIYRARVGGGGLAIHEDDLWIPLWRSMVWTVASGDRVWGSGSVGIRRRDGRPVDLLLTRDPGRYRSAYPSEARLTEVEAADLPARGAAYDGVHSLMIDGSAAAPRAESVAAAAAAGVTVVLLGALPPSHAALPRLAPDGPARLGGGVVVPAEPGELARALATRGGPDADALLAEAAQELRVPAPELPPPERALIAALIYSAAVLAAIRFGRLPGVVAATAVALVVSLAAWRGLRPDRTEFEREAAVEVGAGGLALRHAVREVLTLPAGRLVVELDARGAADRRYATAPGAIELPVQRWSRDRLTLAPALVPSALRVEPDGAVRTEAPFASVWVVGAGELGDLPGGAQRAPPAAVSGDSAGLSAADSTADLTTDPTGAWADGAPYAASLLAALPAGSAVGIARDGARVVALPPAVALADAPPPDANPAEGGPSDVAPSDVAPSDPVSPEPDPGAPTDRRGPNGPNATSGAGTVDPADAEALPERRSESAPVPGPAPLRNPFASPRAEPDPPAVPAPDALEPLPRRVPDQTPGDPPRGVAP